MARILILQNDEFAPAGDFGKSLEKLGSSLTTIQAWNNELDGLDTSQFDGAVILGGRTSAYDDENSPFLPDVVSLIQNFHQQQKPLFGICLGSQLLARAMGSPYRSNDGWEIAFTELERTSEAENDPVFSSLPARYQMYEMHQDTLFLPENATLLASSLQCKNQAYRVGRTSYAVQFHPEVNAEIVQGWVKKLGADMDESQQWMTEAMLNTSDEQFSEQAKLCYTLAENWLALVKKRLAVSG